MTSRWSAAAGWTSCASTPASSTGCGVGEDFDLARYRRAMGINLDGVVFGLNAALRALQARGGGAIVATSSLAGLTGVPYDPVYSANKHAVVGLVRSLAPGLAADGVRLNAMCPGFAESAIVAPSAMPRRERPRRYPRRGRRRRRRPLIAGDATGECMVRPAGPRAAPFEFRGVPGPR